MWLSSSTNTINIMLEFQVSLQHAPLLTPTHPDYFHTILYKTLDACTCQDPLLRGKSIESEGVSNLPARRKGSLMTPNEFRNTRRDGRMIQTQKRKREKRWEAR